MLFRYYAFRCLKARWKVSLWLRGLSIGFTEEFDIEALRERLRKISDAELSRFWEISEVYVQPIREHVHCRSFHSSAH